MQQALVLRNRTVNLQEHIHGFVVEIAADMIDAALVVFVGVGNNAVGRNLNAMKLAK